MVPRKLASLCAILAGFSAMLSAYLGAEFLLIQQPFHAFLAVVIGGLSFAVGSVCLYPEWFLKVSDHE